MHLEDLKPGQLFTFPNSTNPGFVWEYRGGCWFGNPSGYDGGPWIADRSVRVTPWFEQTDGATSATTPPRRPVTE